VPLGLKRRHRESRRALCLGALVMRGDFEEMMRASADPYTRKLHENVSHELDGWLERTGLVKDQSPEERRMFAQPAGTWADQDVYDASWRRESLGTLHWALRVLDELPPWDRPFDRSDVIKPLGLFEDPADYESAASRRPKAEIEAAREQAASRHREAPSAGLETSIAFERHYALNWLCGRSKSWDDTRTDA
jgi:hypothetical protein